MQGRASKQYIFRSCNIYFQCYAFSCENPFTCQSKKVAKKVQGFQISHFYGSFSNETMAVMGLKEEHCQLQVFNKGDQNFCVGSSDHRRAQERQQGLRIPSCSTISLVVSALSLNKLRSTTRNHATPSGFSVVLPLAVFSWSLPSQSLSYLAVHALYYMSGADGLNQRKHKSEPQPRLWQSIQ